MRERDWAAPHAVARVTGKVLTAFINSQTGGTGKVLSGDGNDWKVEWGYFDALAGWTHEDKYRSEGYAVLFLTFSYAHRLH